MKSDQFKLETLFYLAGQDELAVERAIGEVESMGFDLIYPPCDVPHLGNSFTPNLQLEPGRTWNGVINEQEAVALYVVMDELTMATITAPRSLETRNRLMLTVAKEIEGFSVLDYLDGFTDFVESMRMLAWIRERMVLGYGRPDGGTIGSLTEQRYWDIYERVLNEENMLLTERVLAVVGNVRAEGKKSYLENQHGGLVQSRLDSYLVGFNRAKKLFLEVEGLFEN